MILKSSHPMFLTIPGVIFLNPTNQLIFSKYGLPTDFVQDNEVKSPRGVLRGLHYQLKNPQGKLVRVIVGSILDVAVDIRIGSPFFGKSEMVDLSSENNKMFYVPEGFAHGYIVTSKESVVIFKCTNVYDPDDEYGIKWNDEDLNIDWGLTKEEVQLSEKDENLSSVLYMMHLILQ